MSIMALSRLVFLDHGYHQHTGSSTFFLELLKSRFDVVPMIGGSLMHQRDVDFACSINELNPDHVVFYQLRPRRAQLARLRCTNVVWVPMYDDVNFAASSVRRLRGTGLKVIHFSDATRLFFGDVGFSTLSVRYFPKPDVELAPDLDDGLRVFFWIRRSELSWAVLKELLGDQRPDSIILRLAPDPGESIERPSAKDIATYRIKVHEGWLDRTEYRRLMRSCNVFMAPRLKEGIGMALLEAMAAGLAPIAPDSPTMNEYIRHGDNGFLFDPAHPQPIRLDALQRICVRARESVAHGYEEWRNSQGEIARFVEASLSTPLSPIWRIRRLLHR